MTQLKRRILGAVCLALLLGFAQAAPAGHNEKVGAAPELAAYVPVPELDGHLTIAGSETMAPIMAKFAAAFTQAYPQVKIVVEGGGSEEGIREFLIGYSQQRRGEKSRKGHDGATRVSLLASSRELTAQELKAFSLRYGYTPTSIPIALDAVAVYVRRDNPIQGLTLEQLDAIFSEDRKRGFPRNIKTWGDLGLRDGWKEQPIHLYGRNQESGTREFFKWVALLDGEMKEEIQENPGPASEILAIARDPLSIGYAGIGFLSSYVRAIPLATKAGAPFVAPQAGTVLDRTYPLGRFLYLYVNQAPGSQVSPVIKEFLRFVNSREGQEIVARARLYPLPVSQVEKNLAAIGGGAMTAFIPGSLN
jgi:phosphate transport system substrate-binding protein